MNKIEAIALLKSHAGAMKARGATSLYLFGSAVRDEARADSDLDLFIDYDQDENSMLSIWSASNNTWKKPSDSRST